MSRQTIAIDIDDVLADSTNTLRLLVNARTNSDLTTEDYRVSGEYWGYYERVWAEHGLSDRIKFSDFEKEMEIDQSHVPLLPSAEFAIRELSRQYHVVLVTARNIEWERATKQWLKLHFGDNDIAVHYTGHRSADDYRSKGQLCKELGAFLMIDDNPGHCKAVMDEGIKAVLFGEYGWHGETPDGVVKCKDWPAVLEYINELG
jgi:5'(3')-deoxyribonucleotidase